MTIWIPIMLLTAFAQPEQPAIAVDVIAKTCTVTLTANPPDGISGWTAQFFRDGTIRVGTADATAPYSRTTTLNAGIYVFTVQWTKGTEKVTTRGVKQACPVLPPDVPPPPPPPPPPSPVVAAAQTTATPGQSVIVSVTNGPGGRLDWLGLYQSSAPPEDGSWRQLSFRYLNGTSTAPTTGLTTASVNFPMPATPGTYHVRLFANDGFVLLATSPTITVSAPPPPPPPVGVKIAWEQQLLTTSGEPITEPIGFKIAIDNQVLDYGFLTGSPLPNGQRTYTTVLPDRPAGTYSVRLAAYTAAGESWTPAISWTVR